MNQALLCVAALACLLCASTAAAVAAAGSCQDQCLYQIAESLPMEQVIPQFSPVESTTTYDAFMKLITGAKKTLHIAAFYFNLMEGCSYPQGNGTLGCNVYKALRDAKLTRNVDIRITCSVPSGGMEDADLQQLQKDGILAELQYLDFGLLYNGSGVLHTKFIVADFMHFYVGSANMDWSSLTQVKELGVFVRQCPCLAQDLLKIWDVYELLGKSQMVIPKPYPSYVQTKANMTNPMQVTLAAGNVPVSTFSNVFMTTAPPELCPPGRTSDIDALVNVIQNARTFVNISVMDFYPLKIYVKPERWWPTIIDALASASIDRGVQVNLLISKWNHSSESMFELAESFRRIQDACEHGHYCKAQINVRVYVVPDLSHGLVFPYTRVNHAKYMVTDQEVFITTSNWTADYYFNTAGVSFVTDNEEMRRQLLWIFNRDNTGQYSHPLSDFLPHSTVAEKDEL